MREAFTVDFNNLRDKRVLLDYMITKSYYHNGHIICRHKGLGYGIIRVNNKNYRAHRLACWIFLDLDVSDLTKLALHERICTRKDCWNLPHLYIGTQKQNVEDSAALGLMTRYQDKTHCIHNHELIKENTYINPNGKKECRICRRKHKNNYDNRWKN